MSPATIEAQAERSYVWCTYRDWSFRVLEGILDLDGWRAALVLTTEECRYDFRGLERRNVPILRVDPKIDLKFGGRGHERIVALSPATIFHYGWSWLVPSELLSLCPNVTLHPGKLPRDRGGSPIQNQIRNGQTWTYTNVLMMEEGLDTGPVFERQRISLAGSVDDVWARMTASGCLLTRRYLRKLARGGYEPEPQAAEESTFYRRVKPRQAVLEPAHQTARALYDVIRAHSETDVNTYVHPARLELGVQDVIIDRASLEKPVGDTPTQVLSPGAPPEPDALCDLCAQVNNGDAVAVIEGSDGEPIYLTRMYVQAAVPA